MMDKWQTLQRKKRLLQMFHAEEKSKNKFDIMTKITQNQKSLLSEIGEKTVLFRLLQLTHEMDHIHVMRNLSKSGYDIAILNSLSREIIKVEVKTRQKLMSESEKANTIHFTLSENEKNNSDFVVGLWYEFNDFFIIPVNKLNKNNSKGKFVYKHIITKKTDGNYSEKSIEYKNNWALLLKVINKNLS